MRGGSERIVFEKKKKKMKNRREEGETERGEVQREAAY